MDIARKKILEQKRCTTKKNILQLKLIDILRTSSEKSNLSIPSPPYIGRYFLIARSVVKFLPTGHQSSKSDTNDQRRLRTKPQSYSSPSLTVTVCSHDTGPFILEILWNRFYGVFRISLGIFSSAVAQHYTVTRLITRRPWPRSMCCTSF